MYRHLFEFSQCADFVTNNAAELVQLVFQTLPFYRSMDSQRAVVQFLKQTVRNEAFMKAMAGGIVRQSSQRVPRQDAYTLLCWSSTVVQQFELPSAKKAVLKLAECQVDALHICKSLFGPMHLSTRQITSCLCEAQDLFPHLLTPACLQLD